ncbi:MAG: NAD(P)-dependent oxidoreductase [Ilumatobacteraceae bacterium]
MTRVLYHLDADEALRAALGPLLDGLDVEWCAEDDEARLAELLATTEVWWHVLRPITAADIERAPNLRLIQKLGAGVNTIDLDAARARGITVCNLPGANAVAVAESTVAMILAALRRHTELDRRTRAGHGWPIDVRLAGTVRELGDCTIGLVGHGHIARQVEQRLASLGAGAVLHHTRADDGMPAWRTLPALLGECDVVSLHIPLTPETTGLLGPAQLAAMKPGAILVNTSRGGVVDEPALIDALQRGHLGGAALDVFAAEPIDPGNPLLALDNVLVQPHVAWLTTGTVRRCTGLAAANARRLAAGDPLDNVVP